MNDFILILGIELIPSVSGIVTAILPGMDENNEELRNLVSGTLDSIADKAGKKYLYGAIWLCILR